MAKCLKDKVSCGHYILICSVLDRVGGQKLTYNPSESEDSFRVLSQKVRDYTRKKKEFINKEHREMEKKMADGSSVVVTAPKTGINWFRTGVTMKSKPDDEEKKNL